MPDADDLGMSVDFTFATKLERPEGGAGRPAPLVSMKYFPRLLERQATASDHSGSQFTNRNQPPQRAGSNYPRREMDALQTWLNFMMQGLHQYWYRREHKRASAVTPTDGGTVEICLTADTQMGTQYQDDPGTTGQGQEESDESLAREEEEWINIAKTILADQRFPVPDDCSWHDEAENGEGPLSFACSNLADDKYSESELDTLKGKGERVLQPSYWMTAYPGIPQPKTNLTHYFTLIGASPRKRSFSKKALAAQAGAMVSSYHEGFHDRPESETNHGDHIKKGDSHGKRN